MQNVNVPLKREETQVITMPVPSYWISKRETSDHVKAFAVLDEKRAIACAHFPATKTSGIFFSQWSSGLAEIAKETETPECKQVTRDEFMAVFQLVHDAAAAQIAEPEAPAQADGEGKGEKE